MIFARASSFPHTPLSPLQVDVPFSCGYELAVGVNARLPFGAQDGGIGFFLEQHRKHEQRENGRPRERRRVVGCASQWNVQFRRGIKQLLREQFVFEPLEFGFLNGAERYCRRWPQLEARFGAELGRHECFIFVHILFLFLGLVKKQKTRDWLAIAGLLKILFLNQKFVPTMPKWQTMRVQMDILCPLDWAGCSMVANVVFIFNGRKETSFRGVCQIDLHKENRCRIPAR
jgi:hypothetical protein